MDSSGSEDEGAQLAALSLEVAKRKADHSSMFVSGWDDDAGVTEEQNPHETPQKEILWAAEHGETEVATKLLQADSSLVDVVDDDNYTPLHRACYNNHIDMINLLLSHGASVSAKTKMGWEPLHSACHWNHPECISRLLAAGANVNARSSGDQTPLHIASSVSQCKGMLELLLLHPDIDPFIKNKSGDYPRDIARRTGVQSHLFEMGDPAINYIKSKELFENPYLSKNKS